MPHTLTSGSPNQSLLELIFAVKSLAQQVELYHQDLTRRFDEEIMLRQRDLNRLFDLNTKNAQILSDLPMSITDRLDKVLSRIEQEMQRHFEITTQAINEVNRALEIYFRTTDRVLTQNEISSVRETYKAEQRDLTGRLEVTTGGDVRLFLKHKTLRKILYGILAIATSGGTYGFVKMVQNFLSHN